MNLFIEQLYQVGKPGQAFGQSGELESNMVLKRAGFIAIPRGEQPGFDHAGVYQRKAPAASRLYVAHTGADRIEVIDCLSNTYLRFLAGSTRRAAVFAEQ